MKAAYALASHGIDGLSSEAPVLKAAGSHVMAKATRGSFGGIGAGASVIQTLLIARKPLMSEEAENGTV